MKEKIIKLKKVSLSLLLVSSVMFSNGAYLVEAKTDTSLVENVEVSNLTDNQLKALTNPILQEYQADESHKIWQLTTDSRFVILANQENITNERLAEVVKLINAEFVEKEIVSSSPFAMVYGNEAGTSDILITIDDVKNITDATNSNEAYRIEIDENGVRLTGASENAVLYGLRTIQNLMVSNNGLVYGTIVDYPRMAERRLHVDCARKYISKDWFILQIREMSYMKINTLQMHFSENLGFRIECETDPSIVSDQYLTKEEVREIIKEANKYGIKVIPSLDSPGHVDQILKAHPEYGQISNTGEHYKSGLDITNPEAVEYIRSLYLEYMELFEGCTDFHIGGDEYMEFDRPPFTTQYKSVLNQFAKETIGPDAIWKDAIAKYINDLAEFVHDHGFKPRIWNDGIYYGEKSYSEKPQMIKMHDYIGVDFWSQMSWNRDIANLQTFIDKGHDTIYNFNASFFYYVLRNDKPTDGREQHSFDNLNADKKIFDEWTPGKFQQNTTDDDAEFIKGVSMGIWCDNPNLVDEDVIYDDVSDEMRAMATKSWNTSSNSIVSFEEFQENYRVLGHVAGVEKGSTLPEVGEILPAENVGKVTLNFVSDTGKVLKDPVVKYGTIGDKYSFEADDIYGYRLVSEGTVSGAYQKEDQSYTFVYELHCDKTQLGKEINNQLNGKDYIRETFSDYQIAYDAGKIIYDDETSEQLAVDQALEAILATKAKAVKLEYYPLYVEVTYPLSSKDYVSGYDQYKLAIDNGNAELYSDDITLETMKEHYQLIETAKENLMKPDGNTPTVTSTDGYYDKVYPNDMYSYDKMLDNDPSTKCWFGADQNEGDEVVFEFPKIVNMSSINIIQPSDVGADAILSADLLVSSDNDSWIKVGHISENDLDYTADFEKTPVKYVKILLTEGKKYWYQIQDIKFTYEQIEEDSALKNLIKEAQTYDITNKDLTLVSNMVDALIEAQKEYVNGSVDTSEVQANLRAALDRLSDEVVTDTDKTALKIAVDLANAITDEDLANVVQAVADEFKAARDEANAVYNNASATQVEVNNAFDRLANAMHMLDFKQGDKTALKAFIDKVTGLDSSKYTETTWTQFNDALTVANGVYEDVNAMQPEVNEAYTNLVTAFLNLRLIPDKSLLEELINQAEGLNVANYTKASFDGLTKALDEAKVVFENPNASQVEVDNAKAVLEKAIAELQTVTTDSAIKTPVNNGDITSVKTGDDINMLGTLGIVLPLGVIVYLNKRRKGENI